MRRFFRAVPVALLLASLATLILSRGAETVPLFAARTGNLCAQCHFDPNGGGPRNDFGFAYARNRHSLEAEPEGSAYKDLDLTNKIGDRMPVHIDVNQRVMVLTNNTESVEGIDRLGFFNMENALHFAFQPHPRLALVYTMDAFSGGSFSGGFTSKDAFGMIGGFPLNGYLKAGRFRNPFGLRIDDHTVATRNSFLDLSATPVSFLPYDPRHPDTGIEIGAERNGWYGRLAYTNGGSEVFAGQFSETKAVKLGYNNAWYQGGFSFYDNYQKNAAASFTDPTRKRATRWGYYGLTHYRQFSVLGEIAAGTDEAEPTVPGTATGAKTNRLACFAELNYTPIRWFNARARYDQLQYHRSTIAAVRDLNTHSRYAFEVEYLPVPFAELRGTVRRIDHEDSSLQDETQGYLQFHFSY